MPAFQKDLVETLKLRRKDKPSETDTKLGSFFKTANRGPVEHVHDLEHPRLEDGTGSDLERKKNGKRALDEIFAWILTETAKQLDAINREIMKCDDAKTNESAGYKQAIANFRKFVEDLNGPASEQAPSTVFSGTINVANIEPILGLNGYCQSARVVIQWRGGTHSDSSMIHVP